MFRRDKAVFWFQLGLRMRQRHGYQKESHKCRCFHSGIVPQKPNLPSRTATVGVNRQAIALIDLVSPAIEQTIGDRGVGVDSAVAEEGPVAADVLEGLQVDVADQNFFAVVRGFDEDSAEGIAEEGCAPKFESVAGS
jgi:hypothetical protein